MPYKIKYDTEKTLYRNYTARCLRMITESTAGMVNGKYMVAEYDDLINPKPEEKRSADEIINGIKKKIDEMK